jgi:hypothetical protein
MQAHSKKLRDSIVQCITEWEYAVGQTKTKVKGFFEKKLDALREDPLWSSLCETSQSKAEPALRFKETDYVTKGTRDINFGGEYRAFIQGDTMSGIWFSDQNPEKAVGSFDLTLDR